MNKVLIDFPERFQANAFGMWMEEKGFDLFAMWYAGIQPKERQPKSVEVEYDEAEGQPIQHIITVE